MEFEKPSMSFLDNFLLSFFDGFPLGFWDGFFNGFLLSFREASC
jgi:hypothetical protein